jgi:hypothetical protein
MLTLIGQVCEDVADCHFRNVGQLRRDYVAGRSALAFLEGGAR